MFLLEHVCVVLNQDCFNKNTRLMLCYRVRITFLSQYLFIFPIHFPNQNPKVGYMISQYYTIFYSFFPIHFPKHHIRFMWTVISLHPARDPCKICKHASTCFSTES